MLKEILESVINDGHIEKRLKIEGYAVLIVYEPPKGYYAVCKTTGMKDIISKAFFDTAEEAIEHAEIDISIMG